MRINKTFKYVDEMWSYLNNTFTICTTGLMSIFLLIYIKSKSISIKYIILFLMFFCLYFALKTLVLILNNNSYIKNGIKCKGKIVDYAVEKGMDSDFGDYSLRRYKMMYLIVEYINPNNGDIERFKTPAVKKTTKSDLIWMEVYVYVKPDGSVWATVL